MSMLKYFKTRKNCAVCRFSRSLTFSAIGAWLGYSISFYLGAEKFDSIIYAFFAALALVLLTMDKPKPPTRKPH